MAEGMKKTPAYFRARMDVLESILSIAHSSINVDGNPVTQKKIDTEIVLARNGVFPSGYDEEKLVTALLEKRNYSNEPLSFSEITRYNTWFNLHPEKVSGKEIITSSRAFTLTIEGTKEDIIKTIR